MAKIGKNTGYFEYGTLRQTQSNISSGPQKEKTAGRPNIKDDFVIPHVGPEISDADVLKFTESLAERIMYQPDRAVSAQANQERQKVVALVG